MEQRDELIELIRDRALKLGKVKLASGKMADYYLDCRRVTLDARGALLIADLMLAELESDWPDAVGGMAVGAVPITAAILTRAADAQRPLSGFFVRKQTKTHGTGQLVEGPVTPGQRVVVVEDVITTGGSSLVAIEQCQQYGLQVSGVLAIVDRLEGGEAAFAAAGHRLRSLFTIEDLGIASPLSDNSS